MIHNTPWAYGPAVTGRPQAERNPATEDLLIARNLTRKERLCLQGCGASAPRFAPRESSGGARSVGVSLKREMG